MKDLRRPDAPAPNLVVRRTIIKSVLIPTSMGLGIGPELDLPLQHSVHDLNHVRSIPPFSSKGNTYARISGIWTLSIEGPVIGTVVLLGDRPNPVIQGIRRQGMRTRGDREQSSGRKVAVIGGKHDKKQ